jgi:histidyl-tRNA synthetase
MRTCLRLLLVTIALAMLRCNALRTIYSARTLGRPSVSASRLYSDSPSPPVAPDWTSKGSGGGSGGGGGGGRTSAAVVQDAAVGAAGGKKAAAKLDLSPPKGTRDFYPEEHRLKSWLFAKWRRIGELYGFEEYDAPVLENEELYIRKAGEEITSQLYNFEDKGGRRLALRPEMTPSLARMVLARGKALAMPLKWMAIPQCWRYERMTKGRRREHYQWNMDIWGVSGVEAEAELLSAIVASFQSMGITAEDVGIKVSVCVCMCVYVCMCVCV